MNTNNIASLVLIEGLKTIKVCFTIGEKQYTYKTIDDSIKVNDQVVVLANGRYKIVIVVKIDKVPDLNNDNITYQWIIQKIDTTEHDSLNALEETAAENLRLLEQETLIKNAKIMLAEQLGVDSADLTKTLTQLKEEKTNAK